MAHSGRRERRWALLAVLILAAAANNLDKYAPVKGANAPQTNSSEASCSPRQAFSATVKTKRMSAWAKAIIQGGIAAAACAKHDTVATCYADAKNYCGWGTSCVSGLTDHLQSSMFCAGSIYQKAHLCKNKRRNECGAGADRSQPDADGCVVSDWGGYWGKSIYEQYGPADEAATGGKNLFGVCMLKEELAARLGKDNEYNEATYTVWATYVNGNANDVNDFYRARGNCSYAKNAILRSQYNLACASNNNIFADKATHAMMAINTTSTAVLACAADGCLITPYSGAIATVRYTANKFKDLPAVYSVCEASEALMWPTRLNPKTDGVLLHQYQLCFSPALQRNKALCEGAVVA
ncbi:hypothetical protein HYH02_013913 [Chlamydomonas schloesseri]|uniref:Uncharacterized protein n=1 Tax=Chlamydomonas schloesseri TaxID=2026947 RepID=A0A835SRC9_9CHLO|nr:hypothetical protein HYH02_013913 [Chlamydomonas schloesseri]|eukprot:KAG2429962.1 hypothetical protein HYH02_013913 [Chlamydomonas schloesseri]